MMIRVAGNGQEVKVSKGMVISISTITLLEFTVSSMNIIMAQSALIYRLIINVETNAVATRYIWNKLVPNKIMIIVGTNTF